VVKIMNLHSHRIMKNDPKQTQREHKMARIQPNEELRLLSKVSKLYYEEGLNQDEIVEKLQLSRSKISRLLKQAREEGIVKITVISPPGIYADVENQIERTFGLHEVIIVEVSEPESQEVVSRELGTAAAAYLQRTVKAKDIIGVSWGSTLKNMVDAVQFNPIPDAHIVQLIGGLGRPESEAHATDLCRRLARLLSCKLTLLPVPGIVANKHIKEVMLMDGYVRKAVELFPHVTVAYVGIGAPTPEALIMRDGTIISKPDFEDLDRHGVVGDSALRFFDIQGKPILSDVDSRVIGITLEQLSKVERVVGVAGGPEKNKAILGALRNGFVDVLITDHLTAKELC
jgi:DNA-binding transcriptional regulator LsrR (DeoR family)